MGWPGSNSCSSLAAAYSTSSTAKLVFFAGIEALQPHAAVSMQLARCAECKLWSGCRSWAVSSCLNSRRVSGPGVAEHTYMLGRLLQGAPCAASLQPYALYANLRRVPPGCMLLPLLSCRWVSALWLDGLTDTAKPLFFFEGSLLKPLSTL
jgi:hypothetical protein